MNNTSHLYTWMIRLIGGGLLAFLLMKCANPVTPQGGPRDKKGPEVVKTSPLPKTLNFAGDQVSLKFDEFVRMPAYGEDIFVSPFLSPNPKIKMSGKKLKVKFQSELQPNTTYVLSFIGIKDQNESNPMEAAFTLAFSTGDVIDSMEIKGYVEQTTFGEGEKEVLLLLFDADSVEGNDFFQKTPAYVTRSGEDGSFAMPYLRKDTFKIYGIIDTDRSNTYSNPAEVLALAPDPLVFFPDSFNGVHLDLVAFLPDDKAPGFSSYDWYSDSVFVCEFTEGPNRDSLVIEMSDTSDTERFPVERYSWGLGELLILSPLPQSEPSLLHLTHLMDTLGNREDTTVLIKPRVIKRPPTRLAMAPKLNPETRLFEWYMYQPLAGADTAFISLRDSANTALPMTLIREDFFYQLKPDTNLNPEKTYTIDFDGRLFGFNDTTFKYKVQPFNVENFGTFKGTLRIKGYTGPIVLEFRGKESYYAYDSVFSFSFLEPGNYEPFVLLDEDGNGAWTPGSLEPYRMPERFVKGRESFSVRANWDFEDQVIIIDPSARPEPPEEGDGPPGGAPPELPPELRINNRN